MSELADLQAKIMDFFENRMHLSCESDDVDEQTKSVTVADISHPYIEEDFTIIVEITKFRTLDVHFFLGHLNPTLDVLKHINTLNSTQKDFRAYIDQDNRLTLTHSSYDVTEESALQTIPWTIDRLVSPRVLDVVASLSKLTT